MKPTIISLFSGAGGESAGKELAFRELGIDTTDWKSHAVNHWNLAVATHGVNFPHILVHQEDITQVTAATFGVSHINLLWASPSCVHHSRARGGKPKEDQQRSHADEVVDRWLKVANVDVLLIENVEEFKDWGPLDEEGQPIKERKGEYFTRFLGKLKALGYRHEWRILCAADYGDPTTRRRFFLQAVKDGIAIVWPDPTHRNPKKGGDMFTGHLPTWRAAAECIDWSIPCPSIFERKRPLAEATLRRIAAGVMRYVVNGRPFIVNTSHGGRLEGLDEPLKTITTAKGGERAICAPTLVGVGGRAGQSRPRGMDEPLGTGTTKADTALVAAHMVNLRGTSPEQIQGSAGSVEEPVRTISAGGGHAALCSAFLSSYHGAKTEAGDARGAEMGSPVPTLDTSNRHAVVSAFIAKHFGGPNGHQTPGAPMEHPLGAVTAVDHHSLVAAAMVRTDMHKSNSGCNYPMEDPLRTVTTAGGHALMAASMVQLGYGEREGQAPRTQDLEAPLGTVVAGGIKHGLVAATLMTNTTGHAPTDLESPMPTVTTGNHQALVAAFIQHYYGTGGQHQDPGQPLHTVTTLARHGLVTVEIDGETYVITDIGMRMLEPNELAKAMGFPDDYQWVGHDGKPLTKRDTVKMIGNACPVNTVAALIKSVVLQRPGTFGRNESIPVSA